MSRTVLPLLLTATTLQGLRIGISHLNPCGGGGGGNDTFIDGALCDPDHVMSPEESQNIVQLLAECGKDVKHVRLMVFLAANFTLNDSKQPTNSATTTVALSGNGGDGLTSINLLMESVVASNKLNSTSSSTTTSIILLVAIKDPFQMTTWHSAALDGVPARAALEDTKRRAGTPMNQQHFMSAVVNVTLHLCEQRRWYGLAAVPWPQTEPRTSAWRTASPSTTSFSKTQPSQRCPPRTALPLTIF